MTEILSLRLYGTVCTQVIFPLSTLSVLRDNDAVVEIELLVPDTLPTSAESSGSNSSYFTNQVISGLHLVNVGKGQQGSLEETMSVGFTPSFGLKQQVVREGPHRFLRQRQQPSSPRSSLPQPNVVTGVWQLPLPRPLFDFGRPSNLPKSRQPWRCGARSATARRLSTKQSAVAPPCVVRRTPPPSFAEKPIDCGVKELTLEFSGFTAGSIAVDSLGVDSIEGHSQVSGKGFLTTGPRIEAGNVVTHRGLYVIMLAGYVVNWNCMTMDYKVLMLGKGTAKG
ncbi:ty3-gypsy retrotransposon protein [Cucumis melo var. makuwa]|uniref:Ty3-gypsy retrotransposon protein n=1 Tax=Cucumis melo var. makuwa TaxID=1194695 RepID=A0A5D3CPH9_CUCMM|nr:ty3-gypsy retrotransposon protein [Cucumis melo var. makuwa]